MLIPVSYFLINIVNLPYLNADPLVYHPRIEQCDENPKPGPNWRLADDKKKVDAMPEGLSSHPDEH